MKPLKEYIIQFVGLKVGKHNFEFEIDRTFFDSFDFDEFENAEVRVDLQLEKKSTLLELAFNISGFVNVNCDLSNEPYDQPIKNSLDLVVKFGDEYNDDHTDILILPHGEYEFNIAQYIYELIVLAVPSKRIHPGVLDGSMKSEILEKLKELGPSEDMKSGEDVDPRWQGLKKLLTDK